MHSPDQREISPIEERFCDQQPPKIVMDKTSNQTFTVHQGVPKETYTGQGIFTVPDTPHVFKADHYTLEVPGKTLIDAGNVNVLLMHGIAKEGRWLPLDPALQQKGLSIEDIVKGYEAQTGEMIEALFVCNPKGRSRVRTVPFSGLYEAQRIFMKNGDAHGKVTINEDSGEVTVKMRAEYEDEIEFKRWENKGLVKALD